MKLLVILFFISVLIILIVWGTSVLWRRLNRYNLQLFERAWAHEKFLMEIYEECPSTVQNKIERYLNSIKPLN